MMEQLCRDVSRERGFYSVFSAAVGMDLIVLGEQQVRVGQGSRGGSELLKCWCETGLNLPDMGHNQHSSLRA